MSATTNPRDHAIVGRDAEVALIDSQIEAPPGAGTRIALFAGETGVGKSRLLDAAADHAASKGAIVLRGGALDAEGMPPYLPFLEALGEHIRAASPDTLRTQAGPLASVLATIFPELVTRLGGIPTSPPLPSEQARLRLFEAIGDFLTAIAEPVGLVVILDDLQWADAASLDLLCYVARRRSDTRILIFGAYRTDDIAQNPALQRALAEMNRLRALSTIQIRPLTVTEIDELAAHHIGVRLAPPARDLLFTHSEGNPFFAEEILRAWVESGALARSEGGSPQEPWSISAGFDPSLPSTVSAAIRLRLGRQSEQTIEILRTAAVIGRTFDVDILAEAAGYDAEQVEGWLREAERAHVVQPVANGRFSFTHDKIRETLYAMVTSVRRVRLHGFIGRVLETRNTLGASALADLAFHFGRSGDRQRGAAYARRAAAQATALYAHSEALTHFRTALTLLPTDDREIGPLLLELGEAALLSGSDREAVDAFDRAWRWFDQHGDRRQSGHAAHRLGAAHWRREAIHEARQAFELALSLFEGQSDIGEIRTLVDLANLLAVSLHEQQQAVVHAERALALAHEVSDVRLQAATSRSLGNLLARSGQSIQGIAHLNRALALATDVDDPTEAAECCACLAVAYFWQADLDRSRDVTRRRLSFAQRSHDPYELRHVYTWLAVVDALQGRVREADRWLDQAQTVVERLASPEPKAYLSFCRGALAWGRGRFGEAEDWLEEALTGFRQIGPGAAIWYLGTLGVVQAARGKLDAARATMEELWGCIASLPSTSAAPREAVAYLAQIALILDDRTWIARVRPMLQAATGEFGDLLIDRLLGEIETLDGHWGEAETYLSSAEALARRAGVNLELARTLIARAKLAIARSDRNGWSLGSAELAEAIALFEGADNQQDAEIARSLLSRLEPGSRGKRSQPGGLSAREADVLRLVAVGKSNRAIAEALVISEKTVENHLSSIYGKINVDNRAAATAFAIHNGLA